MRFSKVDLLPNHVHLLITPRTDVPTLLQKLNGSTARHANQWLGEAGTHLDRAERIERADLAQRALRDDHIAGLGIPVVNEAVLEIAARSDRVRGFPSRRSNTTLQLIFSTSRPTRPTP
jgi:REP element-mobilizing transposase RayT